MVTRDATQFMTEILSMRTETDVEARRAVSQTHFDEQVRFHDRDGEVVGHAGLETFSGSLQSWFPTARFTLAERPQTLGNAIRAYWRFRATRQSAGSSWHAVRGMHFVLWDGERASALYAFGNEPS
jgi:hypothetical protein